jgi:hypothetical protein
MAVINITPGRGDDGEEEEDNETDATPTRTRAQQNPDSGKIEEAKDDNVILAGNSSSPGVARVVPAVVFVTALVAAMALLSF